MYLVLMTDLQLLLKRKFRMEERGTSPNSVATTRVSISLCDLLRFAVTKRYGGHVSQFRLLAQLIYTYVFEIR